MKNINSNVGNISTNQGVDGLASPPKVSFPALAWSNTSSASLFPITSVGTYDLNFVFVSFIVPSTEV